MRRWFIVSSIVLLFTQLVLAEEHILGVGETPAETLCVVYFYGQECPVCSRTSPFIRDLEQKYSSRIHVHWLEIYHNESNYGLYHQFTSQKGIPMEKRGVPLVAVGETYFMGIKQITEELEDEILRDSPSETACPITGKPGCFFEQYNPTQVNPPAKTTLTIPLVVAAGLIDGINPCAFAVLIFLLTFLIEISGSRKRMIKAGTAYITAIYVTYFLAGLGLLSVIQFTGMTRLIVKAAAVVAILTGVINIKDYFWYGRGITLAIPESKKGVIERWVHRGNIPAALVLGFLVSMFELPCTGGVYLAVLALLANTVARGTAVAYLLLYNLMFILPSIVLFGLVIFGMKAENIENWRAKKKNAMRLALGLLLVVLGVLLLWGWM